MSDGDMRVYHRQPFGEMRRYISGDGDWTYAFRLSSRDTFKPSVPDGGIDKNWKSYGSGTASLMDRFCRYAAPL